MTTGRSHTGGPGGWVGDYMPGLGVVSFTGKNFIFHLLSLPGGLGNIPFGVSGLRISSSCGGVGVGRGGGISPSLGLGTKAPHLLGPLLTGTGAWDGWSVSLRGGFLPG